jgi:integrase
LCRAAKPGAKDRFVADGNGLYLRVRTTGAKSWVIRRKSQGRVAVTTLGTYPAVSLADARAHTAQQAVRHGPLAATTVSVREAVDEFMAQLRWRRMANARTYAAEIINTLGSKRVRDVARVSKMIERYRVGRPVAGNRLLTFTRQFFAWAGNEYDLPSPAAHLRRSGHGSKEESRARILSDDELRALWKLEGRHADLLKFLSLVPARISEAQNMDWSEVRGRRWTIPRERTKSARSHWYELSAQALAIMGERSTGRVFRHQTSATATQAWVKRWQRSASDPWTPHDLRRTARSHASGRLGVREEVAEKWMGHKLEGLLAVYNVSAYEPERVALSQAWADEVGRIVGR